MMDYPPFPAKAKEKPCGARKKVQAKEIPPVRDICVPDPGVFRHGLPAFF